MSTIETYQGRLLNYVDPDPDTIYIEDIAHALSQICRFTGHCREFYSVAQHSVLCSYFAPAEYKFEALMHDSTEAYIGDLNSPLKALLTGYKDIEHRIYEAIAYKWMLPYKISDVVKYTDLLMLKKEYIELMSPELERPIWDFIKDFPYKEDPAIEPWNPKQAEEIFLERFDSLWKTHVSQQETIGTS